MTTENHLTEDQAVAKLMSILKPDLINFAGPTLEALIRAAYATGKTAGAADCLAIISGTRTT